MAKKKYKTTTVRNDWMRWNVRGILQEQEKVWEERKWEGREGDGVRSESKWVRESGRARIGGSMAGCFGLSDG